MINVFIPHRWNNDDYETITALLDRIKYNVRDYSVPSSSPFDSIDRRYNVDPQIQRQIKYANVVVCSNQQIITECRWMRYDLLFLLVSRLLLLRLLKVQVLILQI